MPCTPIQGMPYTPVQGMPCTPARGMPCIPIAHVVQACLLVDANVTLSSLKYPFSVPYSPIILLPITHVL